MLLLMCLVRQIAGAAAEEGLSLPEVAAAAKQAAEQCRSVGVATHICTLPGGQPSDRQALHALLLIDLRPVRCKTVSMY